MPLTERSRCRGAGTSSPLRRSGRPRTCRAVQRTSQSTQCASPVYRDPMASPRLARQAATPSRAQSRFCGAFPPQLSWTAHPRPPPAAQCCLRSTARASRTAASCRTPACQSTPPLAWRRRSRCP
eukprot:Mycagemm_TRINITY_DN9175_c0_g2::TRINITY_DN9175_c0_g2_i1::g.2316::m.2316 type:complete len:125 gc:universal TRINITY_DN9175_c0_g2_i1:369-743(+)